MVHVVVMNFLCRMMVRRLVMNLFRDVLWAAWRWLRRATWRWLLMNSVLFVQVCEGPALLAGHLLELQKNLLLCHMGIVA